MPVSFSFSLQPSTVGDPAFNLNVKPASWSIEPFQHKQQGTGPNTLLHDQPHSTGVGTWDYRTGGVRFSFSLGDDYRWNNRLWGSSLPEPSYSESRCSGCMEP